MSKRTVSRALKQGGSGRHRKMLTSRRTVSRTLKPHEAIIAHVLRARGLRQHEIAALLGVNQGTISTILSGKRFPDAKNLAEAYGRGGSRDE